MLKVKFYRVENIVLMKVLEQDEEYRCHHQKHKEALIEHEGMQILSCSEPYLGKSMLYVRGSSYIRDNNLSVYNYNSPEEAKEYIEKWTKLIKMFNEKCRTDQKLEVSEDFDITIAE